MAFTRLAVATAESHASRCHVGGLGPKTICTVKSALPIVQRTAAASLASTSGRREGIHAAVAGQVIRCNRSKAMASQNQLPKFVSGLMDPAKTPDLPVNCDLGPEHNAALDRISMALAKHKATWRRSLLLFDWLLENGHEVDERLCATMIRICTNRGEPRRALDIYRWMRRTSVPVCSVFTYTYVMKAAIALGELDYALDVWSQANVSVPRENMDSHIQTLVIEALDRKGEIDRALDMFHEVQSEGDGVSVHVYTATIKAATNAGRMEDAFEIWKDMKVKGTLPSGHAYASIINAYGKIGDWKEAVRKFDEMVNCGIRADVVSCTALVDALAHNGCWVRAEKLIDWMKSRKIYPNVRTYSILIAAYVRHGEFERASKLFDQMHCGELGPRNQPNEYTYSLLIKRLGEKGRWKEAESIFLFLQKDIMEAKESKAGQRRIASVNAVICSSLMYAYEKGGCWEKAVEFLPVVDALGFGDVVIIRNIALSALAKAGQMSVAEGIFRQLQQPDGVSYETVIAGYGLSGDVEKAEMMLKDMAMAGFEPSDYSYCGLIAGYSRVSSFQKTLEVFHRAQNADIKSVHLYNAVIAACERFHRYEKAIALLEEMKQRGVQPNSTTHQLMVSVCTEGVRTVESQQAAITAISAAVAAAGSIMMRVGAF